MAILCYNNIITKWFVKKEISLKREVNMKKLIENWDAVDQANLLVFLSTIVLLFVSYQMGYEVVPKVLWIIFFITIFVFFVRLLHFNKGFFKNDDCKDDEDEE